MTCGMVLSVDDGNGYRSNYQQRNYGGNLNRTNSNRYSKNENAVSLQEMVKDQSSMKMVQAARARILKNSTDMDNDVTVVNDKLVYVLSYLFPNTQSRAGILHLADKNT